MFTRSKDNKTNQPLSQIDDRERLEDSESGSGLTDFISHMSRDQKIDYSEIIFKFLIDNYERPMWYERDAQSFRFKTANAMRHFLRKYSDSYRQFKKESHSNTGGPINEFQPSIFMRTPRQEIFNPGITGQVYPNIAKINLQPLKNVNVNLHRVENVGNLTADQIADLIQDRDLRQFIKSDEDDLALEQYKKTYSYQGKPEDEGFPVFDGKLALSGDILLVGDIHVPSTNWAFMERITQIAKRHLSRPRKIAIVGDILNGDKDSRYEHIIAPISRYKEFKITDVLLQSWAKVFDEIYLTPGNHLHRLIRRLEGDIGMNELARLLTSAHEKISMSHYDEVHVTSGDEHWVATHQANYAKSKLKIGNLLAQKFQSNIVTFHQHHSAIGRDDYNRYTVIDCGGMHRQDMMSYVQLVPNVMPNMNNGFVLLRDGTGHLLTPYPSITDWSMWV